MGHWSDGLVDEVAQQIGPAVDRSVLVEAVATAGREIDLLSGHTYHPVREASSAIEPNGLPFVDISHLHVGTVRSPRGAWEIPDPVDPAFAEVLQVIPLQPPARRASPVADALMVGGRIVADASQAGLLSGDFVLHWLRSSRDQEGTKELFRRLMDPAVRFYVPLVSGSADGWWFQIARRLLWITPETESDGRLLELLMDKSVTGGEAVPLAAVEPILTVARMTHHPVDWAFTARIWPDGAQRRTDRTWSTLARAIHGHGIPTITVDTKSTADEIACQVVLKSYWHGYVPGDDPAIARSVEAAYPLPVESIRRRTGAPSTTAAAAMLLEQLVHPGFDPAQGAEATRRYVRRKASIVVMEHRKREHPGRYPWTQVGIGERRYYKLLPLFAEKENGRYDYDHEDVVARMRAYLDELDATREVRAAALAVLRAHGFHDAAARKWLQRHNPEDAINAWPRVSPT